MFFGSFGIFHFAMRAHIIKSACNNYCLINVEPVFHRSVICHSSNSSLHRNMTISCQ